MGESSKESDMDRFDAVEQSDGSYIDKNNEITWYNVHEQMHREDGPALIYPAGGWYLDGEVEWWLNDTPYTFNEWCIALNKTDEEKMMLRLQYD
tara:strand:- start:70 stop:351 length:282 start_codon:yes stop_codon:yes gene_type:complete